MSSNRRRGSPSSPSHHYHEVREVREVRNPLELDLQPHGPSSLPPRVSPSLPSKVYDCRASVVLVSDLLGAGIIELEGGDGKLAYCYFRQQELVTSTSSRGGLSERLAVGGRVRCHCWLLEEGSKVPYLAALVWTPGVEVSPGEQDRILGLPGMEEMGAYRGQSVDLAWQLSSNRRTARSEEEGEGGGASGSRDRRVWEVSPKRERRRSRSRERKRSKERSKPSSSSSRHKEALGSGSRERSRSSRMVREERDRSKVQSLSNRERVAPVLEGPSRKERERESRERKDREREVFMEGLRDPHRSVEELLARNFDGEELEEGGRKRRFSEEGPSRGRGRGGRGRGGHLPKPRMAIGRNVFGGEEEAKGRGGKLAIGRNVFGGAGPSRGGKERRRRHSGGGEVGGRTDDNPGLGYKGPPSRVNNRWLRWQGLCRKKDGQGSKSRSRSPSGSRSGGRSRETNYEEGEMHDEEEQERAIAGRSKSPNKEHQGLCVTVLTYNSEEVGLLQRPGQEGGGILFHLCQVWWRHPSLGLCNFRELLPSGSLSQHLHPGRGLRCLVRAVPPTRGVRSQATAVWLEGDGPALDPRTRELLQTPLAIQELNSQLVEYQTGRLGRSEEALEPGRQVAVRGAVVEYVSLDCGVARLEQGGAALFHLEQVWHQEAGVWQPHRTLLTRPLAQGLLPLGTDVLLVLRPLPASPLSQLRWQALAVWRQKQEQGGLFCRRVEEGALPPPYIARYSSLGARASLLKELENQFDTFKRLAKLDVKTISPVPVLLNLLPPEWQGQVVKVVDGEHGVVQLSTREQGGDMSGDLKLGVSKMFAIFHIEDVFSASGIPFKKSPNDTMVSLRGSWVDLTARSIVSDASCSVAGVFHTAASQLLLSQMYEHVACPTLQAISVFLKSSPSAAPVVSQAPRPTYLRPLPESFHGDEPATAFHLNLLLQCRLDAKALNFFSATNQARLQKEINNGLAMAHFNQQRKNQSSDRAEQQKLVEEVATLDTPDSRAKTYGAWRLPPAPPVQPALPPSLPCTRVAVLLLHQQGLDTREGVLRLELPIPTGHRVVSHAFFDLSCYKFNLKTEVRVRDLALLLPLHSPQPLLAHLLLADRDSPVPYVCTALWSSSLWTRAPEAVPVVDPLFLQKYRRLTAQITAPSVHQLSSLSACLPVPCPALPRQPAHTAWSQQELLRGRVGKVTSIIDASYGLAVVNSRVRTASGLESRRAIVLFDTCDVWVGGRTAQQQDLGLQQVLQEGHFVRLRAILVPQSENRKNIRYLATSLVCGSERGEVRRMALPELEPLETLDQIHPSKINNFYAVVSAVCHNIPGDGEEEARGVSSEEEEQEPSPASSSHFSPLGQLEPAKVEQEAGVGQVARERLFARSRVGGSLDAWEQEMEKRRLAKANECLQTRRKLGYDRGAREALLLELKLKNQLLWRCRECDITCGRAGMEKHLGLKTHWDRVLANYVRQLELEGPLA